MGLVLLEDEMGVGVKQCCGRCEDGVRGSVVCSTSVSGMADEVSVPWGTSPCRSNW